MSRFRNTKIFQNVHGKVDLKVFKIFKIHVFFITHIFLTNYFTNTILKHLANKFLTFRKLYDFP